MSLTKRSPTTLPTPAPIETHPPSNLSVFQDALMHFTTTQVAVDQRLTATQKRLEAEFQAWDDCVKEYTTQLNEYHKLERMFWELQKEMKKKTGDDAKAMKSLLDDARVKLALAKSKCDRLREIKPNHRSFFVRFMMGKVNVHMWKKADRMTFKDEYNKFKRRTTWLFCIFPLIQLFFIPDNYILQTVHQIWLIYYYLSLALRENILLGNGSNIKLWWIYHHYISMAMALALLFMIQWKPMDPYLTSKTVPFLIFGVAQGFIMMIQNHYQSRRNYVRKSLGKATTIDVDSTETLVEKPTDLKILVPLLFLLYGFELYISYEFLLHYYYNSQAGACILCAFMGLGFAILCIGNSVTTALVLIGKSKLREIKRLVVSRRHDS